MWGDRGKGEASVSRKIRHRGKREVKETSRGKEGKEGVEGKQGKVTGEGKEGRDRGK